MAWLWLVGGAWAAPEGCRWEAVETVTADLTHVYIDGRSEDVLGGANWRALQADFERCGWVDSAAGLSRWRTMRQATNIVVGVGLVLQPFWILGIVPGLLAGERRAELEGAIRREGRAP